MSTIDILLAEDNLADVRLTQEAFKNGKISNRLFVVNNGVDALAFLRKEGQYQNSPRPDLILLDLNMPKMDGRETLEKIKSDPNLRNIPVIILTTSDSEGDILKSYDLHANCYIIKPINFENFISVVKQIEGFWFTIVRLPPK